MFYLTPGAQSSMRHSKSMPDGHPMGMMGPPAQSRRLNNKWPSVYTDSGISLLSTDTLTKSSNADMQSVSTSSSRPLSRTMHADMSLANTATLLQESSRRLDDEPRRFVRSMPTFGACFTDQIRHIISDPNGTSIRCHHLRCHHLPLPLRLCHRQYLPNRLVPHSRSSPSWYIRSATRMFPTG